MQFIQAWTRNILKLDFLFNHKHYYQEKHEQRKTNIIVKKNPVYKRLEFLDQWGWKHNFFVSAGVKKGADIIFNSIMTI